MKSYGGYYEDGINDVRNKYPIVNVDTNFGRIPAIIPFSGAWKFSIIMRDLNKDIRIADDKKDNICIYIKGAPEKLLHSCTKILVKG